MKITQNTEELYAMLAELNINLAKMENEVNGMSEHPQTQLVFETGISQTRMVIKKINEILN